jgi:Sec-independent protein translocase protein TatA
MYRRGTTHCGECAKMSKSMKINAEKTIQHLTSMATHDYPQKPEALEPPSSQQLGIGEPWMQPEVTYATDLPELMPNKGNVIKYPVRNSPSTDSQNMEEENEESENQPKKKMKKAPELSSAMLEHIKKIQKSTEDHKAKNVGTSHRRILRYKNYLKFF